MFDIILFAAFAIFMGVKLFKTLGQKDFNHKEHQNNQVIDFPGAQPNKPSKEEQKAFDIDYYEEIEKKHGAKITSKIKEIRKIDSNFTAEGFLDGAKKAFEIILESFSSGNKDMLKNLLSNDIYKGFASEIDKREKENQTNETTLVAILSSKIKEIKLSKKTANIALEIASEQINVVKDKDGKVIEGNPSQVEKLSEEWTFSRDLASKNPNWKLVAISEGV